MICVLDACAMIALLRGEPGENVVWTYLCDPAFACYAHALNLCEVYYDFYRVGGEAVARGAINDLKYLGVSERNDLDEAFWQEVGRVKAIYRKVSLADCCALALAARTGGSLLTSDHHEFDALAALGNWSIVFIR